MINFINFDIDKHPKGLEVSEIQRLFCFKNAGKNSRIVTLMYNPEHAYNEYYLGINSEDVVNMYDYFQKVPSNLDSLKFHPTTYEIGLCQDAYIVPNEETQISKVIKGDNIIAYLTFFDGTYQIKQVNWLNKENKIFKLDEYDTRGFKSRQTFYDSNEVIQRIEYLTPKGEKVLSEDYSLYEGRLQLEGIELIYHKKFYLFNSEEELYTFFLEKIVNKNDSIICEQRDLFSSVLQINKEVKRYFTIQNHSENYLQLRKGTLNSSIKMLEKNKNKVSAVITATSKQRKDLLSFYQDKNKAPFKVHRASLAVEQPLEHRSLSKRQSYKFITAMSFYKTRHPMEMIKSFEKVIESNPKVVLKICTDLYHYYDNELYKNCKEYITNHRLSNNIYLVNYADNLDNELDSAYCYLDFDEFDVQPIGLLSALAHGLPAIVLDTPYGKKIKNNKNGFLIKKEDVYDITKVSRVIQNVLTLKEEEWQSLSENAYLSVKSYYPEKVLKNWNFLLKAEKR